MHRPFPFFTIALSTAALAVWAIPGADATLQFDRRAIGDGELWRLVTGHWAHWGADHLTWDLIIFAVFGALIERRSRRGFVAVVAGSGLAISGALWFAAPQFEFYRGLSGIDSALFVAFFAQLLHDAWRDRSLLESIVPVLALLGFIGKSVYELATGETLFVASNSVFTAVPLAHVVGAAVGVAGLKTNRRQQAREHRGAPGSCGCLPWDWSGLGARFTRLRRRRRRPGSDATAGMRAALGRRRRLRLGRRSPLDRHALRYSNPRRATSPSSQPR